MKHIFALALTLAFSSPAYALDNYPPNTEFPYEVFSAPNPYPMNIDLALSYDSGGVPYCYELTGPISDNTQAQYENNIQWNEDDPECPGEGRTKPSWATIQARSNTAQDLLNIVAGKRTAYAHELAVPALQSDVAALDSAVTGALAALASLTSALPDDLGDLSETGTHKHFTATEKTKLAGIASGATANDTDANLKNRANHTGSQAISTVSGLQAALDAKHGVITAGAAISDAASDASENFSASAVTILGISVPTGASYSAFVAEHNALAEKYNDLAVKFNTLLSRLEAQGLLSQ